MVVEDHEDTRAMVRAVLLHHGYQVAEVETAEEMFERLPIDKPDLIVLDIRLPGMDGCQALGLLREQGFDKPIFIFSEYYDLFSDRIKSCRPDAFFPKSKGPIPLVEGIKKVLPPRKKGGGDGAVA
jgi:CheY-like chemotaxis protein